MKCAAHRRSLLHEAAASEDASRAAVHVLFSDTMRSRKLNVNHYRTTPKPEMHFTGEKDAALARTLRRKTYTIGTAAVHHPPPRRRPPTRQQAR